MSFAHRHRASFVSISIFFCAAFAGGAATAGVPVDPPDAPVSLVRVERQADDDLLTLRERGIPVVAETLGGLIVEGTATDLARLESFGYAYRTLDARSAGSEVLVVALDDTRTLDAIAAYGEVLLQEENLAFLRVEPGVALPPMLEPGCFAVDFLNRKPIALPRFSLPRAERGVDASTPDPLVQQIVDAVDDASIMGLWEDVTDNPPSNTRFSTSIGCEDAARYCFDHYVAQGLSPVYDEWSTTHAPNVVAEITGATDPDEIYVLLGHLDDLPSTGIAPGANDNASGSVTVLEGARVMSCYAFRKTARFLNVTGEEQGLLGSEAYAEAAALRGDDIRAALNFDMPGWEGDGLPAVEDLDVSYNSFSQWLGELFDENATKYGTGLVVNDFSCPSLTASDHASFWREGYPAIIGITDNQGYCGRVGTYPDYHESTDTIANCGDPTFFYSTVRAAVATFAELAEPFVVTFGQPTYACDGTAEVVVGDEGLNVDPGVQETVDVVVTSGTEPGGETLTLVERGTDSKLFSATIPLTTGSPVGGDGLVSVVEGDALSVDYVDPLDCAGNVDATFTATAAIDCTAPAIDGVDEQGVTDTQATIVWTTDEVSDGSIVWGETVPPTTPAGATEATTSHAVTLTGLRACTVYYYEVHAADGAGNLAVADNGGQYFAFETLGDFGAGLQPCSAGQVAFDEPVASCDGEASFHVIDIDLNADPNVAETAVLKLTSSTETEDETVVVTESGPNTSRFEGVITTATGPPTTDGVLQAAHDDTITVTYEDADDGAGRPALSYDVGSIDCAGPEVTDLRVESITDARATVAFTTDEEADAVVEWGTTPSLGESEIGGTRSTSHAVVLDRLDTCTEAYIRIRVTDRFGHENVVDDAGSPHRFESGTIPGLYWKEDFEGDVSGWTLEGEWEVDAPIGAGGSSGNPDPLEAYNATRALGHDLSGQGLFGGDFEPNVDERATSPQLDASAWTNTKLLLYKQLNTGSADDASITVSVPQGYPIYRSAGTTVLDPGFVVQEADLSAIVDGRKNVTLTFGQQTTATGQYSGWNIDDLILKDGSLPDYAACGSCGSAPSFSGATAVDDVDACAATGVTIAWDRAVAWGSGGGGTYAVYRDASPGFTPSPSNRIASGIAATSYTDTTVAPDTPSYWLVRAENDETCATGPSNGGVTDANPVTVGATDATSSPVPAELGGLRVDRVGLAHLRLTWDGASDAASYVVYRSGSPDPATFAQIAEEAEPLHDDLDAGADAETYYYVVKGASACGEVGP